MLLILIPYIYIQVNPQHHLIYHCHLHVEWQQIHLSFIYSTSLLSQFHQVAIIYHLFYPLFIILFFLVRLGKLLFYSLILSLLRYLKASFYLFECFHRRKYLLSYKILIPKKFLKVILLISFYFRDHEMILWLLIEFI